MRNKFACLPLLISFFASTAEASDLSSLIQHPFTTDGCTDYANGTKQEPNLWLHCCIEHDLHFWAGGTRAMRDETDLRLRACVAATGQKLQAEIIYLGVRVGSLSPIKISNMGWGNAWAEAGYSYLSAEQINEITADLPHESLTDEMKTGLLQSLPEALNPNP